VGDDTRDAEPVWISVEQFEHLAATETSIDETASFPATSTSGNRAQLRVRWRCLAVAGPKNCADSARLHRQKCRSGPVLAYRAPSPAFRHAALPSLIGPSAMLSRMMARIELSDKVP